MTALFLVKSDGTSNAGQAIVPFAPTLKSAGTQSFPEATVTVQGTGIPSSFPTTGSLAISGVTGNVTYTGYTGTTFTGCSGGTGSNIGAGATIQLNGMNLAVRPQSIEDCVRSGQYAQFPAPWAPASPDPSTRVMITNGALSAPVAPILVDVFTDPIGGQPAVGSFPSGTVFHPKQELPTIQPGVTACRTLTGIPVTQMLLVLMYLSVDMTWQSTDQANGWTVTCNAWAE